MKPCFMCPWPEADSRHSSACTTCRNPAWDPPEGRSTQALIDLMKPLPFCPSDGKPLVYNREDFLAARKLCVDEGCEHRDMPHVCHSVPAPFKPGYHLTDIPKGSFGFASKVVEEARELADAEQQDCKVMMLAELADLVGAILEMMRLRFPDLSMDDLVQMAKITDRAFKVGDRSL